MSIIVNPHSQQEEQVLLAFLDELHLDYIREELTITSEAQQQEILERDRKYEAGETDVFTLTYIKAYLANFITYRR